MKQYASIFNDVIGPVMIGPSSSHTAASVRIGRLLRQMVKTSLKKVVFEFETNGSLAETYYEQGSDIGLAGGLLNYETYDTKIVNSLKEAKDLGIEIEFKVVEYKANHPNTYKTTLIENDGNETHVTAVSTGGGMIEITEIEGVKLSVTGGFYETIIIFEYMDEKEVVAINDYFKETLEDYDIISLHEGNGKYAINIKSQNFLNDKYLNLSDEVEKKLKIFKLNPVLPIKSQKNGKMFINDATELENKAKKYNLQLWETALCYESIRGNISKNEVFNKMKEIVIIITDSIEKGKKGTSYQGRILSHQSHLMDKGKLIPGDVFNSIIKHITLLMEIKSSMGVIVAAPTAGSCGALPGTVIGTAYVLGFNIDEITKAMLAAGIIGVLIAEKSTFAAEVCGCQAECGSGSGMAAAALVQLMGGSAKQCIDAASMALQNVFGMVCDPVANRVEVPCLGKNIMAGTNAMAAANMILAGYDKVIPLDETIESLYRVGTILPSELRCTGKGGLSITKTSKLIRENLLRNNHKMTDI